MPLRFCFAFAAVLALLVRGVGRAEEMSQAEAEELFAKEIYPVFHEKCVACHGGDPKEIRGGLDMRSRAGLIRGGESGEASVIVNRPEVSPIVLAVEGQSELWSAMPPKENDRLSPEQIASIKKWVSAGAPWPDEARLTKLLTAADQWNAAGGVKVLTSGGLSADWTDRRYDPANLWAYQPLPKVLPGVTQPGSQTVIDAAIDARLGELNLPVAPMADRRTLLRRATFDLTGLPPSPLEIEQFLSDPAADDIAFEGVIERLLQSPHYGEQWGQHWLDVVRYADSSGFANDYERGNAWRYRDYVVRSFNSDKPYDQFIREQIAGDEFTEDAGGGKEGTSSELLIATGFLRMGPWELTGMEVAKIARQRFLDDVTDIVGQVFLGQMLQCARCHDHKFDPVPTRDYYSIQAAFATTQLAERAAPFLSDENCSGFEERNYLLHRQSHYEQIQRELDELSFAAAREWYRRQGVNAEAFERIHSEQPQIGYETLRAQLRKQGFPENEIPPRHAGFSPREFGLDRVAHKGLERLSWQLDRYEPVALSVYSGRTPELKSVAAPLRMPKDRRASGELEQTCILVGGDPFSPGLPVWPGVLSAVQRMIVPGATSSEDSLQITLDRVEPKLTGRRLELANWIASPDNPLTARVIVNRIWQWHFGQAIAGNPNNFGATGKKPTHPELLDQLAVDFIRGGWSIKGMHRKMMMSAAYRRSSNHPDPNLLAQRDPLGTSYACFAPRRLSAEELRDAMLLVTGELNPELGGIPIRPEMNLEAALQPRMVMGTFAEAWQPSPLPRQRHRRSIYMLRLRGLRDPQLEVLNAPTPDLSCEARDSSIVTPQVFALFNGEATYRRALALAARVMKETATDQEALEQLFMVTFGRAATEHEMALCLDHWRSMMKRHTGIRFPEVQPPQSVEREAVEENTGERFSFVEPLEAARDFIPDLQPAAASARLRGLAEVCLVLLNSNEFAYVY